jgi:hypothetical protein
VPKAARHPEVDQESPPGLEPDDQILAAAFERRHPFALQLGSDGDGLEGPDEPRIPDLDMVEPPPDEMRLELLPDRLYLGKLGHAYAIVSSTIGRVGGASSPSS